MRFPPEKFVKRNTYVRNDENTYLENGPQAERNENNSQEHAGIVDLLVDLLSQRKGSVCQDSFIR